MPVSSTLLSLSLKTENVSAAVPDRRLQQDVL
jgi:hypothetical protein